MHLLGWTEPPWRQYNWNTHIGTKSDASFSNWLCYKHIYCKGKKPSHISDWQRETWLEVSTVSCRKLAWCDGGTRWAVQLGSRGWAKPALSILEDQSFFLILLPLSIKSEPKPKELYPAWSSGEGGQLSRRGCELFHIPPHCGPPLPPSRAHKLNNEKDFIRSPWKVQKYAAFFKWELWKSLDFISQFTLKKEKKYSNKEGKARNCSCHKALCIFAHLKLLHDTG